MVCFRVTVAIFSTDFDFFSTYSSNLASILFEFLIMTLLCSFAMSTAMNKHCFINLPDFCILFSASFRYSGAYSLLIQSFIPVHESSSLISSKSVVILPKRRYLDFSVAFFHTQEYLFAFASNLDPSMYRC